MLSYTPFQLTLLYSTVWLHKTSVIRLYCQRQEQRVESHISASLRWVSLAQLAVCTHDWLRGSGTQVGEGVSVRALNFKQLHKFLSSTGDKKLNEVRLCLEGMPGYYLEENSGTWQRLIYRLLPSANQDPIGTIMGPGFASTGIILCSSFPSCRQCT